MSSVKLKCYDLSRGAASALSLPLLGMQLEGVWHTAILCHGLEWFYGGGIQRAPPFQVEADYMMSPVKVIDLGETGKTLKELEHWCNTHKKEFSEDTYDFLHHNCNHFTHSLAQFLLGKGIPPDILNQHEVIAQNPRGSIVLNMIQAAQTDAKRVQQQGGVGGFLATGRPVGQQTPVPHWTNTPDEFEKLVKVMWDDEDIGIDAKKEALRHIHKLALNIITHATDASYRTIKKSNARLNETIFRLACGDALMVALGFKSLKETYEIPAINREVLMKLRKCVELLKGVEEATAAQPITPGTPYLSRVGTDQPDYAEQLDILEQMGFPNREVNIEILAKVNGDVNRALNFLTPD